METAQRVVKRSGWFARLPLGLVAVSMLLLVHNLVRKNLAHPAGIWRIELLDTQAAVAVVLASAGAVLARAQYARTVRPALGWSGRVAAGLAPDGRLVWTCHVVNGSQDVAVVAGIDYRLAFTLAARSDGAPASTRWLSQEEVSAVLTARGLPAEGDFMLSLIAPGRPISVQGLMFVGWFTEKAMAEIENVFLRVQVVDRVGDTHERVMALMKGAIRVPRTPDPPLF
ncbi:hypothetical protein [Kitasatospora sp. NBC_01539]|uniref:hypothetical protein n=1 Tax=Kitasatospora sp. NBC_01539 TaxID=2903577 RepID=UPI003860297F